MIEAPDQAAFDSLPPAILALLQRGMAQHRRDPAAAEFLFGIARSQAPDVLPLYRILIKFYNRARDFDAACDTAMMALHEVSQRNGLPPDWRAWTVGMLTGETASFVLQTLKAIAFLELRRGNTVASKAVLAHLEQLDPDDGIGGSVVAALAAGIETDPAG